MKRTAYRMFFTVMMAVITAVVAGCARPPAQEAMRLWPEPPEEPRLAYIKSLQGASDFQKFSFWDKLFGAQQEALMRNPYGVYVVGEKVYVSLILGERVALIDPIEKKITYFGETGNGKLAAPLGIAVDSDGILYVADTKRAQLVGFTPQGGVKVIIGEKGDFERPTAIALNDGLKRLYVVDTRAHAVKVYSTDGKPLFVIGKRGVKDGEFNFPTGIQVDRRNGNVVVVDSQNFRIQIFDKDGGFLKKFGEPGNMPGNFGMAKSAGIDSEGRIYVTDSLNRNFQLFDENGRALLFIEGGKGTKPGDILLSGEIHVDEKDRLFIADQMAGMVHVYQFLSEKWKKENPEQYQKYLLQPENDKERKTEKKKP